MSENEKTVVETPAGAGSEPTPEITPEVEASPEVKVEVPVQETEPAQKESVDSVKLQEQVENLNTALRQERETNKAKTQKFEEELGQSKETIGKLKDVFSPEQPEEKPQGNLTEDQLEEILDRRDAKRQEEAQKESQAQAIKTEVSTLETEWNGESGKPKYEDKKVLQWQDDNNKLHLSPREAFNEMNRDSIIDWEIKNRMAKKPDVENVETPGGVPVGREPDGKTPKNTEDLRSAVMEAMSSNNELN